MCGRAAQTYRAVSAAAQSLGVESSWSEELPSSNPAEATTEAAVSGDDNDSVFDNYNMSPGMDAFVIWKQQAADNAATMRIARKTWGLVSRPGSQASPIPTGMNAHFSNLMFNARSETLWTKPTFARLAAQGKSCLIALDGFFEWKDLGKGNKKQPYFVYRKQLDGKDNPGQSSLEIKRRPYLLMAGLWTSVPTGRGEEDPTLDTFTILTTDVCPPLKWLHTRMPLCIWDDGLALEWLQRPTANTLQRLEQACIATPDNLLDWHAVSPDMSSLKYRSRDALKPMAAPKKITSFFQKKSNSGQTKRNYGMMAKETKISSESVACRDSSVKKPKIEPASDTSVKSKKSPNSKRGSLDSFFSKKSTT